MPAHDPIHIGSLRATRRRGRAFAGSLAAVVIVLSVIVGLEVSAAALRSTAGLSEQLSGQVANRARKGDRLIGLQEIRKITPQLTPAHDLKLAFGCEPLISPLENARWAKVAGRACRRCSVLETTRERQEIGRE
jgi:hypothetical protein